MKTFEPKYHSHLFFYNHIDGYVICPGDLDIRNVVHVASYYHEIGHMLCDSRNLDEHGEEVEAWRIGFYLYEKYHGSVPESFYLVRDLSLKSYQCI